MPWEPDDDGQEERMRRMRQLLRKLYGLEHVPMRDDGNSFSTDPGEHEEAANLIMAAAETTAALVRNGVEVKVLKTRLFDVLKELAEPFHTLRDMIELWLSEDEDPEDRLEELREYNELLRTGKYREAR